MNTNEAPHGPKDSLGGNLLNLGMGTGPAPTVLPDELDRGARELADQGEDPRQVASAHPTSPFAWAHLAEDARADGEHIDAYAFARVGYHRGLDALRKAGWRGAGPIPSSEESNRGFLQCLMLLAASAREIGETSEVERIHQFLKDADPTLAA